MTYCKNCGNKLPENAQYCPRCGAPVSARPAEKSSRSSQKAHPLSILSIALIIAIVVAAVIAIPVILSGFFPGSQVVGSGNVQTQQKNISDFTSITVGSGFTVQITQSTSYAVSVTSDNNILSHIQVFKTGTTLTITLQPMIGYQTTTLKATISMPTLNELQLSGGTTVSATGFSSTNNFSTDLSGGSRLTMTGNANNLEATCSGGSTINLSDFRVDNAQIVLSGGSHGTAYVTGRLDATLSGGSGLSYSGNPTLGNINSSGGSTISPG